MVAISKFEKSKEKYIHVKNIQRKIKNKLWRLNVSVKIRRGA